MLTWETVLADLRLDMKEGDTPKLSAARAYLYLKFAIRDYSQWNPRERSTDLDLDSSGMATLPADCLSVTEVRAQSTGDLILPLRRAYNPPDGTLPISDYRWWVEGGSLRLNTNADLPDQVTIRYRANHALPDDEDDTTAEMTFPDRDEEAILLYIRAKDAAADRSRMSRLDRYKSRVQAGNTRLDNPMMPEEQNLYDEYYQLMVERYGTGGSVNLKRQRT